MNLILASVSPRRAQLLQEQGYTFAVVPPHGVPEILTGAAPHVLALENACRKAVAVARQHPDALVLGADTIVVREGKVYGKPADLDEAARMLAELVGGAHEVITAVCLIHRARGTEVSFHDRTTVWMYPLTATEIRDYCRAVPVLDKAGAYGIQESGATIVDRIDGSFTNVMGLPVEKLRETLGRLGVISQPADARRPR